MGISTKMKFIALSLLISIALGAPQVRQDTPSYKVVNTYEIEGQKIEERIYPQAKWVCTKEIVENGSHDSGMFMQLFRYISGANTQNENIDMTSPVSTKWTKIDEKTSEHEKCFYLDKNHQENPPKPTNSDVYVIDREEMTILTRTLYVEMNEADDLKESEILGDLINKLGIKVNLNE